MVAVNKMLIYSATRSGGAFNLAAFKCRPTVKFRST